jgi:Cu-Zn family superoxide dismutase
MKQVDSDGVGNIIGMIVFQDTAKGLKVMPNLSSLAEGQHGIHVHENPNCGPMEKDGKTVPGLAAGGHFDPQNTGRHEGPTGGGHLGDLPVLYVDAAGKATRSMWAPRLKTSDLTGRAIIIHAGGDNYSDNPAKLGGGGARVACGVVVN